MLYLYSYKFVSTKDKIGRAEGVIEAANTDAARKALQPILAAKHKYYTVQTIVPWENN